MWSIKMGFQAKEKHRHFLCTLDSRLLGPRGIPGQNVIACKFPGIRDLAKVYTDDGSINIPGKRGDPNYKCERKEFVLS